MPKSFAITAAKQSLTLDANRKAEASFTVTNSTDRALKATVKARALETTQAGWLNLGSNDAQKVQQIDIDLPPKGTQQVAVKINVPANVAAGAQKLRADVIRKDDPDSDFDESQVVVFNIPAVVPQVKKPFPFVIVAVVAVVVLLGGGATTYFLLSGGGGDIAVPQLAHMPYAQAESALKKLGLAAARDEQVNNSEPAGQVYDQSPKAGNKVSKDATVTLTVAKHDAPAQVAYVDYSDPKVQDYPLDICRDWGANCGKPAADAFCAKEGLVEAMDFHTGNDKPPTRVIGTGQICSAAFCDRITWVRCAKSRGLTIAVRTLDAAVLQRLELRRTIAPK